jgi:hypothetical protein
MRPVIVRLPVQIEESSVGGPEPAGVAVKGTQVRLVVDMKPLTASPFGFGCGSEHELAAYPAPLEVGMDGGVQHEGMRSAVPADVDEPHQSAPSEGADPGQAVAFQPVRPRLDDRRRGAKSAIVQVGQGLVIDGEAHSNIHVYLHVHLTVPHG